MSDLLNSVLKFAEKVQEVATPKPKVDGKKILEKYFIPRVEEGKTEAEFTFRILPAKNADELFVKAFFYNIQVNGQWKKIYCLAANEKGEDPIQDLYDVLRVGDDTDKKLASKYKPKEFWILKGIERGKEHEGVKFWRFAHSWEAKGVLEKILPIFKKYGDITDPVKGIDITLTCSKTKDNNNVISTILPEPASPLTNSQELTDALLNDPITWKDVFRKEKEATVEYLTQVAENKVPYWDDSKKAMVTPGSKAATVNAPAETATKQDMTYTDASQISLVDDDGDLPF